MEELFSFEHSTEDFVVDTLEVLEPWPVWATEDFENSAQFGRSCSMGSYYLVDYWDEYQGYPTVVDSRENDG